MIDEEIPLLRTFRAELAKRSSMLVDEDMKEYFTQQFNGPTASRANYDTQPTIYKNSLQIKPESSMTAELAEVTKVIKIQPKTETVAEKVRSSETTNQASLSELSMTLKAMESSSTMLASSSVSTASSMMASPRMQHTPKRQTVVTLSTENICPRGQLLNVSAILNPHTSKRVTLVEALNTGLLDPKTKTFVDPSTRQRLPLVQATRKGYVDEMLLRQLTSPCGMHDPQSGVEMSLIDALQKKLYDPNSNTFTDPVTSEQISVSEALERGIITESCSNLLAGEVVSLSSTTHTEAFFANSEPLKVDTVLSIGKVVENGLYSDITGKVIDPLSGTDMSIMEAVEKGFISPNYEEIQDPTTGGFVTLTDAVTAGIIDPFKGTFNSKSIGQKLSLSAAKSKGLLKGATCLAEIVNGGCLTEDGKVFDPISGQIFNFTDAIEKGVISKHKKCIMDPATENVISIQEAIVKGAMAPTGMFIDPISKARIPILDAVKQGIVKLSHDDVEFSRNGVKDPRTNEVVTLSEALARGIITPRGTYKDNRTGREMSLQQAANSGLMDRQLVKDLSKPTSMQNADGRNISIAEALSTGLLDPETGMVENAKTRERLNMQEALLTDVISGSDITNILSLISPMMKSSVVLSQVESTVISEEAPTMPKTVSQEPLDPRSATFTDPLGKALKFNTFMTDSNGEKTRTIPIEPGSRHIESSYVSKTDSHYSFTTTSIAKPLIMPSVINETREISLKSVIDTRSGRELDVDDAIKGHLVDLEKGQYTDPVTGETMSLHQAIQAGFIKAETTEGTLKGGVAVKETRAFSIVGVIEPKSMEKLSVSDAISKGILNQEKGLYYGFDAFGRSKPMKISEAIEKGFVIVEDIGDVTFDPNVMLRETKSYILKTVIHPETNRHMNIAEAVSEGIIDESAGLYVNPRTNEKMPIDEAIEKGLIFAKLASVKTDVNSDINKITTTKAATLSITAVVDPQSGEIISVAKAIKEGILDNSRGIYTNPQTGESMTVGDAIDKKLVLAESPEAQSKDPLDNAEISSIHITEEEEPFEATLMEDIHSETVTMSITSVIDPRTMDMVSYDKAVELGILNVKKGTYNDKPHGESMTIAAAMEKGLIHGEVTSKRIDDDTLRSAVSAAMPAIPLKDITSVIDPRTRKPISFDKALKDGIINLDKGTYYNPVSKTEISLDKAQELGYLLASKHSDSAQIEKSLEEETMMEAKLSTPRIPKDSKKPWSKVDMELEKTFTPDESMNESSLAKEILHYSTEVENGATGDAKTKIPPPTLPKRSDVKSAQPKSAEGMSYMDAVKLGLVNEDTGRVRDPRSGGMLTLQEAIDRGVIDPNQKALEEPISGKALSLKDCLARGIMDPTSCEMNESKAKMAGYSEKAIPQGSENIHAINIIDAVEAGLYNHLTHKFLEPKTGGEYSLQEGLNFGIIEGSMVTVKDTVTFEKVPLSQAVKLGLINGDTSAVYDTAQHETVPLPAAIKKRLVEQRYDLDTEAVIDGHTGEAIPLRKAIADGDISANSVFVLDTKRKEQVPMDEALQRALVDRSGSIIDSDTGKKMSPTDALKCGLLAIAGAPIAAGMLVADALKDKKENSSKMSTSITRQNKSLDSPERTLLSDRKHESLPQQFVSREETFTKSVAMKKDVHDFSSDFSKENMLSNIQTEQLSLNNNRIKTPSQETQDLSSLLFSQNKGQKQTFDFRSSTPYTASTSSTASDGPSEEIEFNAKYKEIEKEDVQTTPFKHEETETKVLKQTNMKNLEINWETGTVLDRSSDTSMTVTQAVQQGLIDSDYVEDLAETTTHHLSTTPEVHIDWDEGAILETRTGKTFTINNALQEGLIDQRTAKALSAVAVAKARISDESYTLNDVIKNHQFSHQSGEIIEPASSKTLTVQEALCQSIIDGNNSVVVDPESGREMSLQTAIDFGIFDPVKGELIHKSSGERISMQDAKIQGLIPESPLSSMRQNADNASQVLTLQQARARGIVNEKEETFEDPLSGETMSVSEAIEYGLIASQDETDSIRRSPKKIVDDSNRLSFAEALDKGFINLKSQQYIDPGSGQRLALLDAIHDQIMDTSSPSVLSNSQGLGLTKALENGLFDERNGNFTDPVTGSILTFEDAVDAGKLDPNFTVYEVKTGEIYSLEEGLNEGKIDPRTGKYIDDETGKKLTITEAVKIGALAIVGAPVAASIGAKKSTSPLSDNKTKKVSTEHVTEDPDLAFHVVTVKRISPEILEVTDVHQSIPAVDTSDSMTLFEAIASGYLNQSTGVFKDPNTGNEMQASDAIMSDLIQKDSAMVRDPDTGRVMNLADSLSYGVLDDNVRNMDARTGNLKNLDQLIKDGTIQETPASVSKDIINVFSKSTEKIKVETVYDPGSNLEVSLDSAIDKGIIHLENGTYENPVTGETMSLEEATREGLIHGAIFDRMLTKEETSKGGLTYDVVFSEKHTFHIDAVKDTKYGQTLPFSEAARQGIIDTETNTFKDTQSGEVMSIREAIQDNLVAATGIEIGERSPGRLSSEEAVVTDSSSFQIISVVDPATKRKMSVTEAVDEGVLDASKGILTNRRTGEEIGMSNAFKKGLLQGQEISSAAVESSFGDTNSYGRTVFDPDRKKYLTWKEAIQQGIINPSTSTYNISDTESMSIADGERKGLITKQPLDKSKTLTEQSCEIHSVYDPCKEELIDVTEAISSGLLDMKSGIYYNPLSKEAIPVQQAYRQGLIEGVMKEKLNPASVQIGDFKIKSAIDTERDQTLSGKDAAQAGIIDTKKASFVDTESGKTLSILEALKEGLVTLESDIPDPVVTSVSQKSMTITAVVDPVSGEEMTMSEAIGQGVFDADKGEIINLLTGEHISLEEAIDKGLISADVEEGENAQEVAVINGVLITGVKDPVSGDPISITGAIERGILDKEDGLYKTMNGDITLRDALKRDYIEGKDTTEEGGMSDQKKQDAKQIKVTKVFDPSSGNQIGLEEAIEQELVDVNCTVYNNPVNGVQMLMEDAMKEGLVAGSIQTISKSETTITSKGPVGTNNVTSVFDTETGRELSVEEAISTGILDPFGIYRDALTGNEMSLPEAIKLGFVVSDKVQMSPTASNVVTFRDALRQGLIDPNKGTFLDEASQKTYSVDEAVRTGLVVGSDGRPFEYKGISEIGVTYSFKNALMTGIIDSENGQFYDSITGDTISIESALEEGYLSPIAGAYGGRAFGDSLVMLNGGVAPNSSSNLEEILDSKTGEKLSLHEAERRGLVSVVRTDKKMTLKEAIQGGLVDRDSGIFHDPVSGETMSIDQAVLCDFLTYDGREQDKDIANFTVNGADPITLSSAISQGYIDTASATFTEPLSKETVSVSQAVRKGFLKPVMTVDDSVDSMESLTLKAEKDTISPPGKVSQKLDETTQSAPDSHLSDSFIMTAESTPRHSDTPRINGDGPGIHSIQSSVAAKAFSAADPISSLSRASTSTPVNFVSIVYLLFPFNRKKCNVM